jgi:hypothetical protein
VPTQIRAAVSLSYSYLLGIYQRNNPDADQPDEAGIEQIFSKQKTRIADHVAQLMIPPEPEQVSVDWHYDLLVPEPAAAGALDTPLDLAAKYGPVSGLGLLALLALGMMMRLAKRQDAGNSFGMEIGLPAEAIEAAQRAARDVATVGGQGLGADSGTLGGVVGQAAGHPMSYGEEAEGVLEAREVAESSLQAAQMLDQVASMAEQDSESVAGVIENWINQSR